MATPLFFLSFSLLKNSKFYYNRVIESRVLPIEQKARGMVMRSKSPELMKEICEYAEQYYLQNGHKLYYSSKKLN